MREWDTYRRLWLVGQADQKDWIMNAGEVIAVLALLFTVTSFWWLYARRGRLVVSEPHSFAIAASNGGLLLLRLPLVLYNTGPKAIVVQNLRAWFPGKNDLLPLPWRTSRSQLKPASDDGHTFPAAFPVEGRGARQVFIEFGGPFPGFAIEKGVYNVRVEAVMSHRPRWTTILKFDLRINLVDDLGQYIAYDNTPPWPDKRVEKAAGDKARELLEKLREVDPPTNRP